MVTDVMNLKKTINPFFNKSIWIKALVQYNILFTHFIFFRQIYGEFFSIIDTLEHFKSLIWLLLFFLLKHSKYIFHLFSSFTKNQLISVFFHKNLIHQNC